MPRYEVIVETGISTAHNLRSYRGCCETLHGHNYKVLVTLGSERLDADGLVYDFKDLKVILRDLLKPFDHAYMNEVPPFTELNPSAENFAQYIGDELQRRMGDGPARVVEVRVFETDSYCAVFRPS